MTADRRVGVRVQVAGGGDRVVGCYRLGSFQVEAGPSPRAWSWNRLPVPAILVSRLGVDEHWQHRGLGTSLMWHALGVAVSAAPAVRARLVVAHTERERTTSFVSRFGFRPFDSQPRWFYLLMRDVEATL